MVSFQRRLRHVLLTSVSLACAAATAHAQAPAVEIQTVEELIVTAQKRSENLQDVPISITAISGDTLAKSGVTNLDNLQRLAPGLTISSVGSGFVSYTYLRGGGTNQIDAGSDPSVAYFIDEVYIGGTAGLQFDLFDIDRVEVLKGPQGTLFGRNAAAGAISIATKRPSETFAGNLNAEVGNYNAVTLRGGITGPISDNLLYRLSVGVKRRDGFTDNLAGTGEVGDIKSYGARGQLEWVFEDGSFLLTTEALRGRNGMTNQFLATTNKTGLVSAAAIAALPPGESFYKHYYNVVGYEDQDLGAVTGRLELATPLGDLTSITAYRQNLFARLQDQDGTIAASFQLQSKERNRTFSQEIRLANEVGENFRWIAGLYYFHGDSRQRFDVTTGPAFPVPVAQNAVRFDASEIVTKSYALFGQATYDFTPELSLTVGGRYTNDRKENQRTVKGLGPAFSVSPEAKWDSFDPAVTLDYAITPDIMAYASYRRGFKSGGFQTLLPATAAIAGAPFLPEQVTSYEIGLKTAWFERRLIANAALYRSDITDQQILRITGPALQTIDNAGETRTDGLDLSINARPIPELRLGADMTFQTARFDVYDNAGAASFKGNSQLRSPDFMGAFSAEYDIELGDQGKLTLRGEYLVRSRTFFDAANTRVDGTYQPGYGLVNVRATYAPGEGDWQVSVWGKNLGDEEYFRNLTPSGATSLGVPGDPLTFGVTLDVNFR